MEVVRLLTGALSNDHDRRVIGRMLFVTLDDFPINLSRGEERPPRRGQGRHPSDWSDSGPDIRLREQFCSDPRPPHRSPARRCGRRHAGLTGTGDDRSTGPLESDGLVEHFTPILVDDARQIVDELVRLGAGYFQVEPEIVSGLLVSDTASIARGEQPQVGMDALALGRPNTIGIIPGTAAQSRGMQIVSLFLTLLVAHMRFCPSCLAKEHGFAIQTIVRLVVVDFLNLIEHVWGLPGLPPAQLPMVKLATDAGFKGAPHLAATDHLPKQPWLPSLLELRNQACAHLDRAKPLSSLLESIDAVCVETLGRMIGATQKIFRDFCAADIRTRMFLVHGQKLEGVMEVVDPGTIKPF